ncbi:MAG: zinc-binding alcohol dehydrogenase [Chloroflexota bacterium]
METQAVVIPEAGRVELQNVALKPMGAGDVMIQTAFTSISAGTERMLMAGQMPHPMLQLPVVPGYETVGKIVEVGADVDTALCGQWVYVGGAHCYESVNPAWGGQSATLITGADRVVPLGEGIPPEQGVLLALAATALHGVDVLDPAPEDRVLVLGQGPVGQLASRLLANRAGFVASVDRATSRLEKSVGDVVLNVDETRLADVLDTPVNAIIEATGSMEALKSALPHLAPGGTILLLGYYNNLDLPYMPLFLKEARLLTAKEWSPGDLNRCRDMIADGTLDVSALLTHAMPVSDVAQGYELALNDIDCLKLVFEWASLTNDNQGEATS